MDMNMYFVLFLLYGDDIQVLVFFEALLYVRIKTFIEDSHIELKIQQLSKNYQILDEFKFYRNPTGDIRYEKN